MEKRKTTFANILDTEMFGDDKQQYFFDIKKTKNQKNYLQITRRIQTPDESFKRVSIVLFENDMPFFVEAMSMVLGRLATGNLGASC